MKNVYKSLIEAIGLLALFPILCIISNGDPVLLGIMYFGFFSIWGKFYQYYSKKGTNAE